MENAPQDKGKTTDTVTDTSKALVEDVNRLKQDVAQLTADAKAHGKARVDDARERFNNALAAAKESLAAHPVAILGAGLLLGYIFGRRGRSRRCED